MADIDYVVCEDCGTLVPEANLQIHQARVCGGRARNQQPACTRNATVTGQEQPDQSHVIDISDSPLHNPSHVKRSIQQGGDGNHRDQLPPRRRQRMTASFPFQNDTLQDVVDLTQNDCSSTPLSIADEQWSCPVCTLFNSKSRSRCEACQNWNPDARDPDPVRRERLISDDFDTPTAWNSHFDSPNHNSSLRNLSGGALLGSLIGGAASYMRGRSVTDGMVEGAVTGAIGGALVDSILSPPGNIQAARSATAMGFPAYPSLSSPPPTRERASSQRQPRASLQVLRYTGADGVVTNRIIRSDGVSTVRIIRPGNEDPLLSLMMANMFGRSDFAGQQGNHIDSMGYEQLLQAFGDGTENMGADEADIQSLPISTIGNVQTELPEGDARQCCICLEDFQSGDRRKTLPCLHGYHADCIDKALRTRACCPICNSRLKP